MSKHDGKLYYIREEDLKLLKSNPKEFWDGVTIIYDKAFTGMCIR